MWRHRPPHAVQLMLVMLLCMALLLTVTVKAFAQEPPSEEQKKEALMRAYVANGNSMTGWNSFDDTAPRAVKTDRIVPPVEPKSGAEKPPAVKVAAANVCTRHGKRKVVRGRSWRCR
jgi:hypothetical protein